VSKMIRYLLGRVKWGELDFLVLDLPPGTGDPSITIAQSIPQARILMVTTPQEVSLADVRRSITLFQRHDVQVAGLVENMSYFRCSHSADPIQIFGSGGGEKLSRETGLPLLGAIPFDLELGRSGDSGVPLMLSAPDSEAGLVFQQVARELSRQVEDVRQKAS
jgi:ATP-binding protein involved in chromosome partitioning